MTLLDPFGTDHPDGYLADSQFDYPGRAGGWEYLALSQDNDFGVFRPNPEAQDSATPLAYLVCDDPNARVGRDFVQPGPLRRPCLQWHPAAEGTYRLEGELGLFRSDAPGKLEVRVIADDAELLVQTIDYPSILTFTVETRLSRRGFIRVLFRSVQGFDGNDLLHYLRIRRADVEFASGEQSVKRRYAVEPSWQCLRQAMRDAAEPGAPDLGHLARHMFRSRGSADEALVDAAWAGMQRRLAPHWERFRKPRFFAVQRAVDATQVTPP